MNTHALIVKQAPWQIQKNLKEMNGDSTISYTYAFGSSDIDSDRN